MIGKLANSGCERWRWNGYSAYLGFPTGSPTSDDARARRRDSWRTCVSLWIGSKPVSVVVIGEKKETFQARWSLLISALGCRGTHVCLAQNETTKSESSPPWKWTSVSRTTPCGGKNGQCRSRNPPRDRVSTIDRLSWKWPNTSSNTPLSFCLKKRLSEYRWQLP